MKLTTVATIPVLATLLALPLSAMAAESATEAATAAPAAAEKPAADTPVADTPAADTPAADKPVADATAKDASAKKTIKDCPMSATRIKPKGCDGAEPYRKYSKEEMDSTGRLDMAEALRQLDPIFQ